MNWRNFHDYINIYIIYSTIQDGILKGFPIKLSSSSSLNELISFNVSLISFIVDVKVEISCAILFNLPNPLSISLHLYFLSLFEAYTTSSVFMSFESIETYFGSSEPSSSITHETMVFLFFVFFSFLLLL